MTYVYLIYEKEDLTLERYLKCVDFNRLPEREICEVVYDGKTFNFFKLDSLEFNIANKVFRYKEDFINGSLFTVAESKTKFNFNKDANSKLFYDYFEDITLNYQNFVEKLTIKKSDHKNFMNMFERTIGKEADEVVKGLLDRFTGMDRVQNVNFYFNQFFSPGDVQKIVNIYLEEGKIHRLLKTSSLFVTSVLLQINKNLNDEIYYPCDDQDVLFKVTRQIYRDNYLLTSQPYVTSIEEYFADMNLKWNNVLMLKQFYPNLFDFYEKEIFATPQLTILEKPADEIAKEIVKLRKGPLFTTVLKILFKRIKFGEEISDSSAFNLCRMGIGKTKYEIYLTTLRRTKNFDNFVSGLEYFPAIAPQIFDVLMEKIEFGMQNITKEKITKLLNFQAVKNLGNDRKNMLIDYLKLHDFE